MQETDRTRRRLYFGLIQRRQCWLPTVRGWTLLFLVSLGLVIATARWVHPFLAVSDPISGGGLVAEGWMPDYAMEQVIAEFRRNPYTKIYVTGGPIERGRLLQNYRTSAEAGAAMLVKLGLNADAVRPIPAPRTRKDRTYISAIALRNWFLRYGVRERTLTVISLGVHARRSRALFQTAIGSSVRVGVLAIEDRSYDPSRWWRSSEGFRTVTDEVIAYLYAKLLFDPGKEIITR
jgi:hypothetical protein